MTMPPAVLLGGQGIAVSIARSLGKARVSVYALGDADFDTVGHSRYCTRFVDLGSGEGVQDRWLEWLLHAGPPGAVILPCSDDALELLAHQRASLEALGYLPFEANDEVVLAMLDKEETYRRARALGLATPKTVLLAPDVSLDEALAQIGTPCALKPVHAHRSAHHFGLLTKAFVVDDAAGLERAFHVLRTLNIEVILTEIIPGGDDRLVMYYSYLDDEGKPLFHLTKQKIRQYPPHFGIGCYQVTKWDPEVAGLGLKFFQGIGLRGPAAIEFKRDERDGVPKVIECNHRFTAAIELLRAAGIDVALLAYSRILSRPAPQFTSFIEGIHMWSPVEDTRSSVRSWRAGEMSFLDWARSLLHKQHFPIFSWSDPKPSLVSYWQMAVRLQRRLRVREESGESLDLGLWTRRP